MILGAVQEATPALPTAAAAMLVVPSVKTRATDFSIAAIMSRSNRAAAAAAALSESRRTPCNNSNIRRPANPGTPLGEYPPSRNVNTPKMRLNSGNKESVMDS
ncbi:hypothetical protein RUM44_006970 [Polyplax serrata]|uniref:Uncharacterized protein n=1 Tax=Polyplax serrata TaxID=468196 RepID=A0ABR1AZD6_POLSC